MKRKILKQTPALPSEPEVRSSVWLAEAEASLRHAHTAVREAGLQGEWNSLVALENAVKALKAGIALKRPPSANEKGQQ